MISAEGSVFLLGAGLLAGVVGTAGGITSLISYPALLAVGVAAWPANVANIVALVVCGPGSAIASRPELEGKGRWLRHWALVVVAGGAAGAGLLLSTPAGIFGAVVPYLVAAGSLALLLQPRLSAWQEIHSGQGSRLLLPSGLFAVSAYSGYFGAGSGVMTLALLLLTAEPHVARANALKNVLICAATVAAAVILALSAPVDWSAVAPLAAGLFAGSTLGPRIARRLPGRVLRWLVALIGFGLAIELWLAPG